MPLDINGGQIAAGITFNGQVVRVLKYQGVKVWEAVPKVRLYVAKTTSGSLNVRSGPGQEYESLMRLDSADLFFIIGTDATNGYVPIVREGALGWVSTAYVYTVPAGYGEYIAAALGDWVAISGASSKAVYTTAEGSERAESLAAHHGMILLDNAALANARYHIRYNNGGRVYNDGYTATTNVYNKSNLAGLDLTEWQEIGI